MPIVRCTRSMRRNQGLLRRLARMVGRCEIRNEWGFRTAPVASIFVGSREWIRGGPWRITLALAMLSSIRVSSCFRLKLVRCPKVHGEFIFRFSHLVEEEWGLC
jgi:hypothetical protein